MRKPWWAPSWPRGRRSLRGGSAAPAVPALAKRLEDVGCASLMPLGSAIGSGRGLATAEMLRLILRDARIPVIVDAGLRSPSEAAAALEMGGDAVLVNSAVAASGDPIAMAAG